MREAGGDASCFRVEDKALSFPLDSNMKKMQIDDCVQLRSAKGLEKKGLPFELQQDSMGWRSTNSFAANHINP